LLPENDSFSPIKVDLKKETMVIEGIVVGLVRNGMPVH
jgi:repressor LexA